jgi:hypothetical protein
MIDQIIQGLLGPGVTVLGSELPYYRNVLMGQMAVAIASGEKLMGLLEVRQCRVLYLAGGRAEYDSFMARVGEGVPDLDVRASWARMGKGCTEALEAYLKERIGVGVASLGDYAGIRRELPFLEGNVVAMQDMSRQKDYHDLRDLRDWSARHNVAVVLGHDLGTKGTLVYPGALKYRDNELRMRQVRGVWILEVMAGSRHVTADAWAMDWDEDHKCFRFPPSVIRRRSGVPLPLNDNERLIVNTLWDMPLLTFREIRERTGIPYTTLHDRLKALQTRAKGERLIKLETEGEPARYMADTSKGKP